MSPSNLVREPDPRYLRTERATLVDSNVLIDVLADDPQWADWSIAQLRALKLMHAQFAADARSRERFELEARVGAQIASDHVVAAAPSTAAASRTPSAICRATSGRSRKVASFARPP